MTTGREGKAHVLPEAVCANDLVMPPGAMCVGCNSYFSRLDSALALHPLVALPAQALGIPGKRGKSRAQLGYFQRVEKNSKVRIGLQPHNIKTIDIVEGHPRIVVKPVRGRNRERFHRSLYYVGFNLLSCCIAAEELLGGSYDAVRRYIRQPKQREIWPYCHAAISAKPVDFVHLSVLKAPTPQVAIFLFNHAFAVDLFGSPTLRDDLQAWASKKLTWSLIT